MIKNDYSFSSAELARLYADLAPISAEERWVGEVIGRDTLKPAAALIRLVSEAPDIVTVRFSRGDPSEYTRSTMWRVHTFYGEPVLSSCPLNARVDGSLTLPDVAPVFDAVDDYPFQAFIGTEGGRRAAFQTIAGISLQLRTQQV